MKTRRERIKTGSTTPRALSRFNLEMKGKAPATAAHPQKDEKTRKADEIQHERLKQSLEEEEKADNEKTGELEALRQDVESLPALLSENSVSAEDLSDLNGKMAAAKAAVETLQSLIAEQQGILGAARESLKPAPCFTADRQALLADIAMGSATYAELEALDLRIGKARQEEQAAAATANPAIEGATHTIQGLTRKLEDAKAALSGLESERKALVISYLEGEAGKEEARYLQAVSALVERYTRMLALNRLMESMGRTSLLKGSAHKLEIPALTRMEFSGKSTGTNGLVFSGSILFDTSGEVAEKMANALELEIKALKSMGDYLA